VSVTDCLPRLALIAALVLVPARVSVAQPPPPERDSAMAPSHRPAALSGVDYRGDLNARYSAAIANLLTRTDRYGLDSFRASAACEPGALWWDWPGDQIGRWFSVLHVARARGWTPAAADRAAIADVVLPLQRADGHFGPEVLALDQKDARIPSGNAFCIRGLCDAYRDTGDTRYLDAARKLARYFGSIAPHWRDPNTGQVHEFYGHCVDGLVHLYELGGDTWALDLAKDLGARAGRSAHTHHALSMHRGVLDLYRVTGDPAYLERAEDYLLWCRENRLVSGGLPESMPSSAQDEGCGLADYLVTNLMAFSLTGKDLYLHEAENLLVNHLAMNQFHTGGFGHRAYSQEVVGGKVWQGWDGQFGSENPGCCSLWGAWALGTLGGYLGTEAGDAVEVNLYPECAVALPDEGLRLEIESDYPRMTFARVRVWCEGERRFPLRLRVPPWARGATASVNGSPVEAPSAGERLVLDRLWKSDDVVELRFPTAPRIVRWPSSDSPLAAVFAGPLCLGLSSAAGDVDECRRVRVSADGAPAALDAAGKEMPGLAPIGEDWRSPDVYEPNRLRILFEVAE